MATVLDIVLMGVVLVGNTFLAAVMTRFFRIQLDTRWGAVVYTVLIVPVVLAVTTIGAFSLGVGVDLGSAAAALALMVGLPMGLGVTIDILYVPAPDEYELPDTAR